jgi:opacity protein-like surface antigen
MKRILFVVSLMLALAAPACAEPYIRWYYTIVAGTGDEDWLPGPVSPNKEVCKVSAIKFLRNTVNNPYQRSTHGNNVVLKVGTDYVLVKVYCIPISVDPR